jgi:hypothetical protein
MVVFPLLLACSSLVYGKEPVYAAAWTREFSLWRFYKAGGGKVIKCRRKKLQNYHIFQWMVSEHSRWLPAPQLKTLFYCSGNGGTLAEKLPDLASRYTLWSIVEILP